MRKALLTKSLFAVFATGTLLGSLSYDDDLLKPPVQTAEEAKYILGDISEHRLSFSSSEDSTDWVFSYLKIGNSSFDNWLFERDPRHKEITKQEKIIGYLYSTDLQTGFLLSGELEGKDLWLRQDSAQLQEDVMRFWTNRYSEPRPVFSNVNQSEDIFLECTTNRQEDCDQIHSITISGLNKPIRSIRWSGFQADKGASLLHIDQDAFWSIGDPNDENEDLFWMDFSWKDSDDNEVASAGLFSTISFISRQLERRFGHTREALQEPIKLIELMQSLRVHNVPINSREKILEPEYKTIFSDELEKYLGLKNADAQYFIDLAEDYFGNYHRAILANCPSIAATYVFSKDRETENLGYFTYQFIHAKPHSFPRHPIWLNPFKKPDGEITEVQLSVQSDLNSPPESYPQPQFDSGFQWRKLK